MKKEAIYIAGPECFYLGGEGMLNTMRQRAENHGFDVTLPNDTPLNLQHTNLQLNGDVIFANCIESMNRSTIIICDLEFFRGPEVDGGSVFELGMAFARGMRCYGYTRDKRNMVWKYQGAKLINGKVFDQKGRKLPYHDLPFSPNVIGSTKIIQGDFDDCLQLLIIDLEEERKKSAFVDSEIVVPNVVPIKNDDQRKKIFLSGPERYEPDCYEKYEKMKEICSKYGFAAYSPLDKAIENYQDNLTDPYMIAYQSFMNNQQHVRNCDLILANLNMFHAWEPESDTSFECGMAFQLGKKMFAYMSDTSIMRERIPNYGPAGEFRDICGSNVENFNYPINLMFSSCMKIFEGDFEEVVQKIANL